MFNLPWCWHDFAKWNDPVNGIYAKSDHSIGYFGVCQMRTCNKCGLAQYRRLPKMRSLESLKSEQ